MIEWRIDFSSEAEKFLIKNKIKEQTIIKKIALAIEKFQRKQINIDEPTLKSDFSNLPACLPLYLAVDRKNIANL